MAAIPKNDNVLYLKLMFEAVTVDKAKQRVMIS